MAPSLRRLLVVSACAAATLGLAACGEKGIELAKDNPNYEGAKIFDENCAGCHTLSVAGAAGSATNVGSREPKDGPNFDDRKEDKESVLYAIRNGGFSSSPMPQNLVTGETAEMVADFVAKYSGSASESQPTSNPGQSNPQSEEP
jgi:mono/diheme cytochrome c family protein